ncbi:MAG: CBASS cGAMP-activated phospholipase [Isosphaeraceae bacterium]
MNHFRILSLDGGGIKGAFTASVLATLEEVTGKRVLDHFDLITGTSTGGIIAVGLGMGLSAGELREFYRSEGSAIFPSTGLTHRLRSNLRHLFRPKQSQETLRRAIARVLGDRKLGESQRPLVIPAYDAVGGRIYLFKTPHHAHFSYDFDSPAVDVAVATAAAPTYYSAFEFPRNGVSYIDGGVWANCPVLVGLAEATNWLDAAPKDIDILSIGTTTEPFYISERRRLGGILSWNKGLVEIFMFAQVEAALAQANLITGGQVHRIDAVTLPGRFLMDDARAVDELIALGDMEARKRVNVDVVKERFLNGDFVPPFVPNHLPGRTA